MMQSGTFFCVIQLPSPWPFPQTVTVIDCPDPYNLKIVSLPVGQLAAWVQVDEATILSFLSRPIRIIGKTDVLLLVRWGNGAIDMRINGKHLDRESGPGSGFLTIRSKTDSTTAEPTALLHPDAIIACQDWIKWRATYLSSLTTPSGRRMKSASQQWTELENETKFLRSLLPAVQTGQTHLAYKLAASLRALLFWKLRGLSLDQNYNPLLLRVASWRHLALPVFAHSGDGPKTPAVVTQAAYRVMQNCPEMGRKVTTQTLMDVQQWLEIPVLDCELNAKDVIAQTANTLGGAHFDPGVPEQLDHFRQFHAFEKSALATYLVEVARTVINLADYVLQQTR